MATTESGGVHTPHSIVSSSALPTGAATAANQSTGNTSLSSIDTKLSSQATAAKQDIAQTALDAIKAAIELLDNTVSGSELQVDIVSSALPSGAATSANQATANAALAAIQAAVEILDNAISGSEMQVDVVTSALPSGASTSAKQDTAQTALDAIKAAVELLDNAISGSELQVDVVASLPAGNNNIGDVDIASIAAGDNNIGNVDVVTMPTTVTRNDSAEVTGSITANGQNGIAETSALNYKFGSLQITGTWSGTIQVQGSNDNSTWRAVFVKDTSTTAPQTAIQSNDIFSFPIKYKYVRVRSTAWTSGTANLTCELFSFAADNVNEIARYLQNNIDAVGTEVANLVAVINGAALACPPTTDMIITGPDGLGAWSYAAPAFAKIDAASSGDNTIVAAQGSGTKIRVLSLFLVSAGTVTTRFESGASGTALTGQMNLVTNGGFVLPYNPNGWFECADNQLLNLELSGAISVDGSLTYVVVPV